MEVKVTGAPEYGNFVKALICGVPGSGKTLISSTAPRPFYASAEGGLMSIADRGIPYVEIRSSDDLHKVRMLMAQPPEVREQTLGFPVETLVVDTIDEIQKILMRERVEGSKSGAMELKDWGWLADQVRTIVRGLRNLDMNVILTAHLKKDKDEETGRVSWAPALQGAVGDEIAGYVDLALLLKSRSALRNINGESARILERSLQTYQDVNHPWIKDRSGRLPQDVPVNFVDDFQRIHELIYSSSTSSPTPTAVVEPSTSVQAALQAETAPIEVRTGVEEPSVDEETAAFICDECGAAFDSEDQAELSRIKLERLLCAPCYKPLASKPRAAVTT